MENINSISSFLGYDYKNLPPNCPMLYPIEEEIKDMKKNIKEFWTLSSSPKIQIIKHGPH